MFAPLRCSALLLLLMQLMLLTIFEAAAFPSRVLSLRSSLSSSSSELYVTPAEMGRRAELLARGDHEKKPAAATTSIDTILAHSGGRLLSFPPAEREEENRNSPLAPALHFATTYTRQADGRYPRGDPIYTRVDNPTRLLLEQEIARLELHGHSSRSSSSTPEDASVAATTTACAFASGMMAVSSIILAHQTPLHVILPLDLYHGVSTVLPDVFARFQVTVQHIDMQAPCELEAALTNATLLLVKDVIVWIETPSNPLNHVIDIASICQRVNQLSTSTTSKMLSNVTIVVDSTLAPPTITQPLVLGADLVLHSATKYLSGHSDALLGVVTASPWTQRGRDLEPLLRQVQVTVGGVASPMDSWLTLRGLRTLSIRVQRQCETAKKLAVYLSNHPSVSKVYYPGMGNASDEQSIVKRQMKLGGGMLSVEMDSESKAMALAGALQTIQRATSLGGTETLIEHRASIEPPNRVSSPVGLLRIAVGLEDADDLIADLQQALTIVDTLHS